MPEYPLFTVREYPLLTMRECFRFDSYGDWFEWKHACKRINTRLRSAESMLFAALLYGATD